MVFVVGLLHMIILWCGGVCVCGGGGGGGTRSTLHLSSLAPPLPRPLGLKLTCQLEEIATIY